MPVNRQEKELELGGSWRREKCKRKRQRAFEEKPEEPELPPGV